MKNPLKQDILNVISMMGDASDSKVYESLSEILLQYASSEKRQGESQDTLSDFHGFSMALGDTVLLTKIDAQGNIFQVNDSFAELLGYSQEELLGEPLLKLCDGLHEDSLFETIWKKISLGEIWRGEVKKKAKNRKIYWFNATILPVLNDENKIDHFISFYTDISPIKKAEDDLELFLHMIDLSNDAIQVATEEGVIIYVNERSEKNLGYHKEELLGRHVRETEATFSSQDDWNQHVEMLRGLKEGLLAEGENIRKDGTRFPVEANVRWIELAGSGYVIAILRDISDRHTQKVLMEKTQHILTEAQMLAKIASFEIDLDNGTVLHSENAREIIGLPDSSDITIESIIKHVHVEDVESVRKAWLEASTQKIPVRIEFRIVDKNGEIIYILGLARTITHEAGTKGAVLCTAQNVTNSVESHHKIEKRTLELESRNAELDQFAQIVSHDLKSPLRAIHNLGEWIKESKGHGEEKISGLIDLLQRRIEKMDNLVNGILQYSSAGRKKEDNTYFSAYEVLNDICESHQISGVHAKFILDDMPDLLEDRLAFEQVMSNLISNAIKHNDNINPEVYIHYDFVPGSHRFCVEDNGSGIDSRFHSKVFQIFQTLNKHSLHENTGVGLAIVQKLCDEKDWLIKLQNREEGGCSFFLEIPN